MSTVELPSPDELNQLFEHRADGSVTLYLPSTPNPTETAPVRLHLKNAVRAAEEQLQAAELPKRTVWSVVNPLRDLVDNDAFWREQALGLAILAAPGILHTYLIPESVPESVNVGSRWDLGPLLRHISGREDGYVAAVAEGSNHLFLLARGERPRELQLELPDDLESIFQYANNAGDADFPRPEGATGERIEHRRYCKAVQDAVLARIRSPKLPMVLAAIDDFQSAYREINSYPNLLTRGIESHPDSLSPEDLDSRAGAILDEHYREQLKEWGERFGTRRAHRLGVDTLQEAALAASAAAIEDLLYDVDAHIEGSIDETGALVLAEEAGPDTYDVVDEIAGRVYRSGGQVRAVASDQIPGGTPLAAILRFPVAPA